MPSKVQGDLLPPGWKVSQKVHNKVSKISSYYLNDMETLKKLKEYADRSTPMTVETKRDSSYSLLFSTGAYLEAVTPLISFWKEAEGADFIDKKDTDGLEVKVNYVETETEKGGKSVKFIVRLNVHGENTTVTCYDTTVSMRVQGGPMMEKFSRRALIPYLEGEIKKKSMQIRDINMHFQQLGSTNKSKSRNKTTGPVNPSNTKKLANFKASKMISEQQLDESDTSIISVASEEEDDDSLELEVVTDIEETAIEVYRQGDFTPKANQVVVLPDATFCLENNLAPAPKAVWANLNLPEGWNVRNNILTSQSLPSADMAALLEAVQAHTQLNTTEGVTSAARSVATGESTKEVVASTTVPEIATTTTATGGVATTTSTEDVATTTVNGATTGAEALHGLEGEQSPADRLVSEDILLLDPYSPTHDTTGDVMRFLSEMKKQSTRLTLMEERGRRMEELMEAQGQTVVELHQAVAQLEAKLSGQSATPALRTTSGTPQPQSPPPPETARSLGARTRQPPRLPRAPEPADVVSTQANKNHNLDRDTLKCNRCDHTTTSERRMENHIRNMHTSPQLAQKSLTLLVGDSHLGSVNLREVGKVLGRGGMLVTPGATRPREDRAYCSTPEWPGARYPNNSLQQMVPELLGERKYSSMIMLAPTNDITNLKEVQSKQERERLAVESAKNTLTIAEKALESVDRVLIMEQPVRVDSLAELSEFSKSKLREFVRSCPLAGRIKIGSSRPDILNNEEKKTEVFGKPTDRKADGIHMRGWKGKEFFTETLKEAVKCAGLADRDTRMGTARESARRMEQQEPGWSRVERGVRPAPRMESRMTSWADLASNRYSTLSN